LGPKGYKYPLSWPPTVTPSSQTVQFDQKQTELISLSSIVAPQAPKSILDFYHQNLREKAANFDWRADPLIPKVKRAFGSRLAGVLEFITLGALLLAG
jgi:hypothetical protein